MLKTPDPNKRSGPFKCLLQLGANLKTKRKERILCSILQRNLEGTFCCFYLLISSMNAQVQMSAQSKQAPGHKILFLKLTNN